MLKIIAFLALMPSLSTIPQTTIQKINREEVLCLTTAIYHEARGESLEGQTAVAHTILNRVKNERFPDTICDVVYAPRQFSYIRTAAPDYESASWSDAVEIAIFSITGLIEDPTQGAMWYYAHGKVLPAWALSKRKEVARIIGNHTFLREKRIGQFRVTKMVSAEGIRSNTCYEDGR